MTAPPPSRAGFWELVGAGVAVGGTGVWGLAVAARVGTLRLVLDLFPASWWDGITWGLIPVLLLLPPVLQGATVAWLAPGRYARVGLAIAGSIGGTVVAGAVFGTALFLGVRHLPSSAVAFLARTAPVLLIIGFIALILAGWVLTLGVLVRLRGLRRAALPLGVAVTALAWILVRGHVLALSYVLEHTEAEAFFASVTLGGAVGAAWISGGVAGDDLTPRESVGYNPPALTGSGKEEAHGS